MLVAALCRAINIGAKLKAAANSWRYLFINKYEVRTHPAIGKHSVLYPQHRQTSLLSLQMLMECRATKIGCAEKHFVAGDVRANENSILTTLHTLFVREHNRLCDELKSQDTSLEDEQLFQEARRRIGAYLQSITYEEWLPAMGANVLNYQGYDSFVNPSISNVFSGAAYRLGHTLINSNIMRLDEFGEVIPQGNLGMKDAFFNPLEIKNGDGCGATLVRVQEFNAAALQLADGNMKIEDQTLHIEGGMY